MLLLGGFAIAGALSKHFIAKSMATAILSRVGRQPHWVLLANMLVATFLSMFISNVAAPVLCFGLVQPILRTYAAGKNLLCSCHVFYLYILYITRLVVKLAPTVIVFSFLVFLPAMCIIAVLCFARAGHTLSLHAA